MAEEDDGFKAFPIALTRSESLRLDMPKESYAMPHDFMPGLAGVPAARSTISDVNGETGVLEYRGIRIEELTAKSTFLETAYLLLFNCLPTRLELEKFTGDVALHRRIKSENPAGHSCAPRPH